MEIHTGRGNAIKILTRLLWSFAKDYKIRLAKIEGGNKHNAIPREAFAVVTVSKSSDKALKKFVKKFNETVKAELATNEPDLNISISKHAMPSKVMDRKNSKEIVKCIVRSSSWCNYNVT